MERFVALENIRRFKQHLEICTDAAERGTLEQLLSEEEAKLHQSRHRAGPKQAQPLVNSTS